jgi:hypothetical protein
MEHKSLVRLLMIATLFTSGIGLQPACGDTGSKSNQETVSLS